jgi:hypothetical protein
MGESEVETEARESAVSFLTKELARSPKAHKSPKQKVRADTTEKCESRSSGQTSDAGHYAHNKGELREEKDMMGRKGGK